MTTDDGALTSTRKNFRAALADARGYVVDDISRRPAFISSLLRAVRAEQRRDVRLLPALPAPTPRPGTVTAAVQGMADRGTSSVELVQRSLDAIHQREHELNAFVHIASESALLEEAAALDVERERSGVRGPLHGVPVSIKDIIHVKGMKTTASSAVLPDYMPEEDATVVSLLRKAGAIIVGKTHTHEFALGVTTAQSRNPWDITRDPGGSSGGSAISISTGMSLLGVGTDTRASIRVPAALCGIVGYKPTFGLVSTDGVMTLSWSMDHTGLQAKTAGDVALMMNAVQGLDAKDPGTLDRAADDYTDYLNRDVRGLRVGIAVNGLRDVDSEVLKAFDSSVAALRSLGVEIVETEIPSKEDFRLATSLGLIVSRSEAAAYHASFEGAGDLYTRPVFEQLDEASQVRAVDYLNAQRFRGQFQDRMLEHLSGFDALIMPTTRVAAPKVEESDRYLIILSENCIPWSFIGVPAMSVPSGLTSGGLPMGAQMVASPFADGTLLALASALETVLHQIQQPASGGST